MQNDSYEFLEELTDGIGARLTGTAEAEKAIAWGLEKMRAIGLENVHSESWQLFRGWTRVSAEAELLSPIHRKLTVDSMGWAGSTPAGGAESDLVPVNAWNLAAEMKDNAAYWKGKILLVIRKGTPPVDRLAAHARFGAFLKAAHEAGALAVIGGQGGAESEGVHLTHTGMLGVDVAFEIPVVSIAAEDQEQLERYLARGNHARVRLAVQNRFTPGPVPSANVVGEIRGAESPQEIVVVGGHLDSWDLASGATDNGTGVAATLGAAEAILRSGFRPRRTIRFLLFTGEEQGDDGSFQYVRSHKGEIAQHLAAVILDSGQGPVTGFQLGGRDDLVSAFQKLANSLQAFGPLTVDDDTVFDTDTGPFILAGLPGINLKQDSPEYRYTHHSPADTFDKVRADVLDRNATVMALLAFWIADRPDRLAAPWPAERSARMLIEKHDDVMLKLFGLWPFGKLGERQSLNDAWWTGPMLAPSAATLPPGHFLIEPYLYDVITEAYFDRKGALRDAPHSNSFGTLTYLLYGLTEGFTAGLIPTGGYNTISGGLSSSVPRPGDISLLAQYRLSKFHADRWVPMTSIAVEETFPTGKYDRLGDRPSDGLGSGAFSTMISLYSQKYWWLPNGRILRTRLNLSETFSHAVSVKGVSVYGTEAGFEGQASPGSTFSLDAAGEYSITRNWVLALDAIYHHQANTRVSGYDLMSTNGAQNPASVLVNSGPNGSLGLAPAIEYNWRSNLGVLLGVRVIPAGRSVAATISPAVALNFVH